MRHQRIRFHERLLARSAPDMTDQNRPLIYSAQLIGILVVLVLWMTGTIPGFAAAFIIAFEIAAAAVLTIASRTGAAGSLRQPTWQETVDDDV
jgi:hypothetical protein